VAGSQPSGPSPAGESTAAVASIGFLGLAVMLMPKSARGIPYPVAGLSSSGVGLFGVMALWRMITGFTVLMPYELTNVETPFMYTLTPSGISQDRL
jgi:hypothetical protein